MMNEKKQSAVKRILGTRGMGAVITAFAGLIIIYVAFGLIDRKVFAGQNVMNLLRSMSKYLLIGVGQSYLLITGNIDLSINHHLFVCCNIHNFADDAAAVFTVLIFDKFTFQTNRELVDDRRIHRFGFTGGQAACR